LSSPEGKNNSYWMRPLILVSRWLTLWAAGLCLLLNSSVMAGESIQRLRLDESSTKTRMILDLSDRLPYSFFTLADPYRVVIDLPEVEWSAKTRSANSNAGLVSGYRFGLFQPGNSRFVLDLQQPAKITNAFYQEAARGAGGAKSRTNQLVIDLVQTDRDGFLKTAGFKGRTTPSLAAKPPAALSLPAPSVPAAEPPLPASMPKAPQVAPETNIAALLPPPNPHRLHAPVIEDAAPVSPAVKPLSPVKRSEKRPRIIVIDAGHGGVDPGAITANGVYEKTIVLDTARRLQALISRDRRYKVVMTRDSDVFVRLGDRVQIARNSEADLFVSIHADALVTRKVRGASVYTLSEQASDKEAELLAAKENNSDMIAGIGIGDETDELVKSILIDLAQRETTNKSVHFAKLLLPELREAGALLKNSHRHAGFRVLKAPDVPSVLVELGLLSNNTDARVLTSNSGRQRLAEALKQAIETYFRNHET